MIGTLLLTAIALCGEGGNTSCFGWAHTAVALKGYGGRGGETGIRTPDTLLAYTHFPGVLLKPLGHLSFTRHSAQREGGFSCSQSTKCEGGFSAAKAQSAKAYFYLAKEELKSQAFSSNKEQMQVFSCNPTYYTGSYPFRRQFSTVDNQTAFALKGYGG